MKKIVFLSVFLVLIYGGYKYIQDGIHFEKLSSRIDLIISQPQSYSMKSMKEFVVAEAAKLEIPLSGEDVEITVKDTERRSLGERFIERPGIEVESKLLSIRFNYPVKIYGISRTLSYNMEKVFTSKASMVVPDIAEPNH